MAEMNAGWQKIDRTKKVQEHFWLGEFIQSDRWLQSSPPSFRPTNYPYEKDGFKYSGNTYTFDNEIHVTEITHATSLKSMLSIINDGGFKAKENLYPGIGHMSLVWFGLKNGEKEIDFMKANSKCRVQDLMQNIPELKAECVLSQIAHTLAFQPMSLFGHCKFTLGIRDMIEAYKTQFCESCPKPEMRKLGTFAYKQEIMHAILVCPPETPHTHNCPLLSEADTVIQPDATLETWTWKPHSTGNQHISFLDSGYAWYNPIRWEHVVFAFYIPKEGCLKINALEHCVSFCLERSILTGRISDVNEHINEMLNFIASKRVTERKSLADMLISMIACYLKEEHLYEKTMENNDVVQVNLEQVVQRVQELLPPWDFRALNWSPLTEWMNSLSKHYNVLHVIQKACTELKCGNNINEI